MRNRLSPCVILLAAILLGGLPLTTGAEPDVVTREEIEAMRREIRELRGQNERLSNEIARVREAEKRDWMSERRAEAIKGLVREVLADAQTRASLLDDGITAGHDGSFFLQSADGAYRMSFSGQFQGRYIFNQRDESGEDDELSGFQVRRIKFKSKGHIADPRIQYAFSLAGGRSAGGTAFEDYKISYALTDRLTLGAGRMKAPFAIQELTSSTRQLAVERSSVHETFNPDRSEGLILSYEGERFRAHGMVNDGAGGDRVDFAANNVDFAFTGRAEGRIAGNWSQLKDPGTAWSGEETGLFLGGAVHYEVGETGEDTVNGDFVLWTVDATYEHQGLGLLAAVYGNHEDNDGDEDFDDFGVLLEAGYFLVPDILQPFVRYELIVQDEARSGVAGGTADEETSLFTAGLNWYHHGHRAKFTLDGVYGLDPLRGFVNTSSSLGLRPDGPGEDGQFVLRAQYQLLF